MSIEKLLLEIKNNCEQPPMIVAEKLFNAPQRRTIKKLEEYQFLLQKSKGRMKIYNENYSFYLRCFGKYSNLTVKAKHNILILHKAISRIEKILNSHNIFF